MPLKTTSDLGVRNDFVRFRKRKRKVVDHSTFYLLRAHELKSADDCICVQEEKNMFV